MSNNEISIEIDDSHKLFISQLKIINADLVNKINELQNKYNNIKKSTDEEKSKNYDKYLSEIEEFQDNINNVIDYHDKDTAEILKLMEETKEVLYYLYHLSIEMAEYLAPYQTSSLQRWALKAIPKTQRRDIPEHYRELIRNVRRELKTRTRSRSRSRSRSRGGRKTRKNHSKI